ncbi:MAG: hypothetical protein QOJ35_2828 [Solirubrobacteraceae bacterium]|jgi:hypothetical protein|nr:hypothetical protein [Solirubrobacteraceae bacterium]
MLITRTHVVTAALALSALAPAGALAAGEPVAAPAAGAWSTPRTISAAHGGVYPLGVTDTNTSTVAWWGWQDGAAGAGATFGLALAARPAGAGAFGPERLRTSDELIGLDVQGYGDGRLVALSQVLGHGPVREGRPNPPDRIFVADGDATGVRAPTLLAHANVIGAAQLGIAPGGRGLVAFASYDPKIAHRAIVSAAVRSPSGHFSRPAVISGRGEAHGVVVAIGRRGDMVVAFVRNRKVVARVRRPGHGWGAIQTLATPSGPTQWTLRAAVSDAGSVEVLWHRRFVSDRMDGAALQARRMGPGASRWGALTTIEPIGATTPSTLVAVPGGFAVGYTVRDAVAGAPTTPRVSLIRPRTSTHIDVAPASTGVRDVRLAWSDLHGLFATMVTVAPAGPGVGLGAFLAPGAAGFGPIEQVTSGEGVQDLAPGFDPDGAPLAVWSAPPDGTDPDIPADQLRRVVRTSTRTG